MCHLPVQADSWIARAVPALTFTQNAIQRPYTAVALCLKVQTVKEDGFNRWTGMMWKSQKHMRNKQGLEDGSDHKIKCHLGVCRNPREDLGHSYTLKLRI